MEEIEMASDKERRGIQAIEAGGHLLLALEAHGHPLPLKQLAKAANMAPGKAHPYLVSLSKLGLVTQDALTCHYWLGPTAMELGLLTLRTVNPQREAAPFAELLAQDTGHSVALSVWGNHGPTVVSLVDATYPLHTNMRVGTVMSLAGTATGRLFVAYLPRQLIEESLLEDDRRLGPDISRTVEPSELQDMLRLVHEHGLSRSVDMPTLGVSSFAAPVFDYSGNLVMAVTLLGRTRSFDTTWSGNQAKAVRACGSAISARLGNLRRGP